MHMPHVFCALVVHRFHAETEPQPVVGDNILQDEASPVLFHYIIGQAKRPVTHPGDQ